MPVTLRRALFLMLATVVAPLAHLHSQECPQGRISYIFVDNHSVFDPDDLEEESPFLWAYQMANALHFRTREYFLRQEILFQVGDCYDPLLLEESARVLRAYPFIAWADIYALTQPDGSRHVVVDTRDEWTLKIGLGFNFDERLNVGEIGIVEENLLGLGIRLGFSYEEKDERQDIGVELETPRLMATRTDGRLAFGRTRTGVFFEERVAYPFVGEIGRFAGFQGYSRRETLFPYTTGQDAPYTHITMPLSQEEATFAVGARIGHPGNLTLFGLGLSWRDLDVDDFPTSLEGVRDHDFTDTGPVDALTVEAITPQAEDRTATRLAFIFGQRNLRYVQRTGLDALRGIQDVQLGTEVTLTLGRTIGATIGHQEALEDDLHTGVSLFGGIAPGNWIVSSSLRFDGRQVFAGGKGDGGWRDVFAEGDLYAFWQPTRWDRHTLFFRVSGAGGWSVDEPFQLSLGGAYGVRGYRDEDFPGGGRLVLSAEDRIHIPGLLPELVDFGVSFFVDAGKMWASEAPFGEDTDWHGAVGTGLRFGFPPGSQSVIRVDVAYPIQRGLGFKDIVFRFSLAELVGLLAGFGDKQMIRSRRVGIGPELFITTR